MKKLKPQFALALALLLLMAGAVQAEYWFQTGARATGNTDHNNGASVQIQTIAPQSVTSGSVAFWVGETLSNGAFIQMGYSVSNQTGNLSTNCTPSGCAGSVFIKAGDAEWFYEYFNPGSNSTFYGKTGPDGSAGLNGTFHTYSFYSLASTWYFLFDNRTVGSVNLGASDSGPYQPIAIGEIANTSSAKTYMKNVNFANLSAYKYQMWLPVQSAYGTVNYGVGSKTNIANPYGVQELGTRTNYFAVGSGLPTSNNNTKLWSLGYRLTVNSRYGNLSSRNSYVAYTVQTISTPAVVNLSSNKRAVFTSWSGTGLGFYNGTQNRVQLLLTANITETANWQVQYFVNASSPYGKVSGTGWYANASTARYGIINTSFYRNGTQQFRFAKWSNGDAAPSNSTQVYGPMNITAVWRYRVNLLGKNAQGQAVAVPTFWINGQQYNATPFLDVNKTSTISGAYYKGVLLSASGIVTQNSPQTISIPLPIYNVSIKTLGLFGSSVNASVAITYKNGTHVTAYAGPSGVVNVPNVPYGYANVTVTYLNTKESFVANAGVPVTATFISLLNIVEVAIVVLIFAYIVNKRIKEQKGRKTGKQVSVKVQEEEEEG